MEYKQINVKSTVTQDDNKFYLNGVANTKDIPDSYGDVPHGDNVYDLERMKTNPVCFVDHMASASSIAGNFITLQETKKGLDFKLLLRSLDKIHNPPVKDAVQAWMDGFGRSFSMGGRWFYKDKDNPKYLTKAEIYEISMVGVGADSYALSDSDYPKNMKAVVPFGDLPLASRDMRWDKDSALGRVREWAGIEDNEDLEDPEKQAKYRKAFFWYDKPEADTFGAYKLPFADIVDGQLKAVPRGVFAAAGAMRGARGGVMIPENDRPGVTRNIEKYYKKMGLDSPFGKAFRIDDLSNFDERDFEKILKTGVKFKRNDAKTLISILKAAGLRDVDKAALRDAENKRLILKKLAELTKK